MGREICKRNSVLLIFYLLKRDYGPGLLEDGPTDFGRGNRYGGGGHLLRYDTIM